MNLIVDTEYRGHHSEYLDILIQNSTLNNNIFILHPKYVDSRSLKGITFFEFEPSFSFLGILEELNFINKIIKKHRISNCILLNLNYYFFCLVFFRIKVKNLSCIYYLPHFFDNNLTFFKKTLKSLSFLIFQLRNKPSIFILNDTFLVKKLNNSFFRPNFKSLPDPIINSKPLIRTKTSSKINLLFIGEISARKGINVLLELLEDIGDVPQNFCFTIAGNTPNNKSQIKKRINEIIKLNPTLIDYVNLDRLSNEVFERLFCNTDLVLCLHQVTGGSSGIIGKAILYKKNVIGPNNGLISRIISKNKLGITTDVSKPKLVINSIRYFVSNKSNYSVDQSIREKYLNNHSPEKFVKEILDV